MHLAEIVLQWEGECAQPILGRHHGSQEVNAVSRSDYLTRPRGLGHGHLLILYHLEDTSCGSRNAVHGIL